MSIKIIREGYIYKKVAKGVIKWILGGVILLHFFFACPIILYALLSFLGIKYNFYRK